MKKNAKEIMARKMRIE